MSKKPEWMRDPRTESVLGRWAAAGKLTYSLQEIEISQIDRKMSHALQARATPLDLDAASRYQVGMERGDCFPAIVSLKLPRGKYLTLGGNHREYSAGNAGRTTILAYVIESDDDEVRTLLPRELNVVEGHGPDRELLLQQAMHAVTAWNMHPKEAASRYGIGVHALKDRLGAAETQERLAKLGAPIDLTETHLRYLRPIQNDNVLAKAAHIVKRGKLTTEETNNLSAHVRSKARNEADQLELLDKWERDMGLSVVDCAAAPTSKEAVQLKRAITQLKNMLAGKSNFRQLSITSAKGRTEFASHFQAIYTAIEPFLPTT